MKYDNTLCIQLHTILICITWNILIVRTPVRVSIQVGTIPARIMSFKFFIEKHYSFQLEASVNKNVQVSAMEKKHYYMLSLAEISFYLALIASRIGSIQFRIKNHLDSFLIENIFRYNKTIQLTTSADCVQVRSNSRAEW